MKLKKIPGFGQFWNDQNYEISNSVIDQKAYWSGSKFDVKCVAHAPHKQQVVQPHLIVVQVELDCQ